MSRLDGRFLKVGSIPADRLAFEVGPGGGVTPGSVTAESLSESLLQRFAVVSWGEPVVVDPSTRSIALQLLDLAGQPLEAAHAVRVTCDSRAHLTVGEAGTALSGENSEDLLAQTDETGTLELVVTCEEAVVISVAVGPTQASPMLDCRAGADVLFE